MPNNAPTPEPASILTCVEVQAFPVDLPAERLATTLDHIEECDACRAHLAARTCD